MIARAQRRSQPDDDFEPLVNWRGSWRATALASSDGCCDDASGSETAAGDDATAIVSDACQRRFAKAARPAHLPAAFAPPPQTWSVDGARRLRCVAQGEPCDVTMLARDFAAYVRQNADAEPLYVIDDCIPQDGACAAYPAAPVVAGDLLRLSPNENEDSILMRALRDFNIAKIVKVDEVVFFGLLNDLFPGRDPPRVVDDALQKSVDDMVAAMPDFVDDTMKLKTIQLDELLQIRHCVFVMGPPGAFKSTSWKYLAKAKRIVAGRDSYLTIKDINPKTMPTQDLYGYINMATRDWKDGLLSTILRGLSQVPDTDPKWLMLDGDLDANWIESMNSVMDDNRMLTLASNERIPLKGHMRMVFEIRDLKHATPATVSRAGILYISTNQGTQWRSLIESWVQRRDTQGLISDIQGNALRGHFTKYVSACLKWLKIHAKPLVLLEDINMVQTLLNMLDGLFKGGMKKRIDASSNEEDEEKLSIELEPSFVFCCIWAFGSCLAMRDGEDYRKIFSDYWKSEWRDVKVPSRETVFDYYLNPDTNNFDPWKER